MSYSFVDEFKEIAQDIDTYEDGDTVLVEFRIPFDGQVRGDTRSSVRVNPSTEEVVQATIRLPETKGDPHDLQDQILMMSKRIIDSDAGCYVRETGRIHLKYPVSGQAFGYTVPKFIEDMKQFRSEVESRGLIS